MRIPKTPKLSHHRILNRGYFTWKGKRHYVRGKWPAESNHPPADVFSDWADQVRRLLAGEELAPSPNEREVPAARPPVLTNRFLICELVADYLDWADSNYLQSNEAENLRCATMELLELFGELDVSDFSPKKLKAVRDLLEERGKTRQGINKRIKLICRVFRWGAEEERCSAAVYDSLRLVSPLRRGHTRAPESTRKGRVDERLVEATLPYLAPQVAALVRLGLVCAARPSELTRISTGAIDRSDPEVWWYLPARHKTQNRDPQNERIRQIPLGPKCQAILGPWLCPEEPGKYLFSPAERMAEHRLKLRSGRKSRVQPSQMDRRRSEVVKTPGDHYTTQSLGRAIRTACLKHGIPHWSPGQLRKSAAQKILKAVNIEAARATLGHADQAVTRNHYVVTERALAKEAALRVG